MDARPEVGRPARRPAALAAVFAIVIAACSGASGSPAFTAAPTAPPTAPPTPAPTASPAITPSPSPVAQFPLTVTDDEGTQVTIPSKPDTIVSLTPAVTETLFALGVGDEIKGKAEDIFLYPPEAKAIPDVAKFGEVDIEKIVGFSPDVVIAGGLGFTPPDAITKLRSLHVPVVVVYPPDVATVYKDIELVGAIAGKADEARAMTATMRAAIASIGAAVAGEPKPKVFYETGTDDSGTIYGVADKSFLAEMIQLADATPITTGSPDKYAESAESLIAADPDLILLSDAAFGVTAAQVAKRPGWKVMTAVKSGPSDRSTIRRSPARGRGSTWASRSWPRRSIPTRRSRRPHRSLPSPDVTTGQALAPVRPHVGLGARADGRLIVSLTVGLAVVVVGLIVAVAIGTVSIAPADTLAIVLARTFGLEDRCPSIGGDPGHRLGHPHPAGAHLDRRRGGARGRRRDLPGPAPEPARGPVRAGHGVRGGARCGDRRAAADPASWCSGSGSLHALAFLGALIAVFAVYRLSRIAGVSPMTSLLLTGYAVGSLLAAGLAMAMYLSGAALRQIFAYLLGAFDGSSWERLAAQLP